MEQTVGGAQQVTVIFCSIWFCLIVKFYDDAATIKEVNEKNVPVVSTLEF